MFPRESTTEVYHMRLKEPTEVRQHQIIQAARKIIISEGMEHLTIEAIAEEVGLTEGAIYRHFSSKQDILLMLIEEIDEVLFERLEEAQREATSAMDKLEQVLDAHLSQVEQRGGVSFIVIAEALRFGDPEIRSHVADLLHKYEQYVVEILRQGIEAGEIRPDVDPTTTAQAFFGLVQGSVTFWSLQERSTTRSLARRHGRLWDIFARGVAAQ